MIIKKEKPFRNNLAVDVTDMEDVSLPKVALIKYDGVYALVKDGVLLGRSLKQFKNEYITKELSKPEYEGLVGELCYGEELNTQHLCRTTTSKVNTIKEEGWKWTWVVFDYIGEGYIGKSYLERLTAATQLLEALAVDNIQMATNTIVATHYQVEEMYENSIELGYEGLILREPTAPWKNGRSTAKEQGFMRMKPQSDAEALIIGIEEAMENNNVAKINELGYTERSSHQENKVGKGMVGSFICICPHTNVEFKVGAGKLSHEEREYYWENPPIGDITKYRSMTTGVKDKPRFPRHYSFRADEDLDQKLLDKVIELRLEYGMD